MGFNKTDQVFLSVALMLASNVAVAQGNVSFGAAPAVLDPLASQFISGEQNAAARSGQTPSLADSVSPGISRVVMPPVTPEQSDQAIKARVLPPNLNQGVARDEQPIRSQKEVGTQEKTNAQIQGLRVSGDTAALAPVSIAELARGLGNNPDNIYQYVRNHIGYYPTWGIQKGALGAVIDNQGTSFDQSELMVALLRQSGFTASVVKGRISLTAAQVKDWLGVETSNICAVLNLFGQAQIPVSSVVASAAGSCPGSAAALVSLKVDHVWVKAVINGTTRYFDPSFKSHTVTPSVDLVAATGYNAASYLTSAKSGATLTPDFIQNVNRTNIRNNLTTYANTLATYLRTNKPAASLDDVIGGKTIVPDTRILNQGSLPYQDTTVPLTEWTTDIPANFRATLRIQFSGIDQTYTSDAIYGKRLSITYNGSNQPLLSLDGVVVSTGTALAAGSTHTVTFTASHPYGNTFANQTFGQSIRTGGTYVIGNGWGPAGRGLIEVHRNRLEAAKAAGVADTSESVLGSSLAVLSANWIAQTNHSGYVTGRLAKANITFHHQIGIAGYNTAAYVDLPGNVVGLTSELADAAKERAAFYSYSMRASVFESTAVQQTTGGSAVSTTKLIDIAALNGNKIFDARSSNYLPTVQPQLLACTSYLAGFQAAVNAGRRLILPERCDLTEASWRGVGYFDISSTGGGIGALISGGLLGGFSSSPLSPPQTSSNTLTSSISPSQQVVSTGNAFGDPIDMSRGSYLYAHSDFSMGSGAYPQALKFERVYSSGIRLQKGPLGLGWAHNFAASSMIGSDGFQSMGEDSGLDAVGTIVEHWVSLDLLSDPAKPLDKMVVASLGNRWFGDQLINNTINVRQGLNGEVFVKLPDGTYNPPPGKPIKLTKNPDNSVVYEAVHKDKLNFNASGQLTSHVYPQGLEVRFTYSGSDLVQVQNSLGRSLTLTNVAGRITQVSDGTRLVKYVYDSAGNLVTYTDANNQNTTFQYDLPGRMTKLFYPSNPTVAFLTNVYDSLGRVQTQTNAHGKLYTYLFAGVQSQEIGPGNTKRSSQFDAMGNLIASYDPLGRVTRSQFDGQSRLAKRTFPAGNSLEFDYDDATCLSQLRCTHNVKTVRQLRWPGPSSLPTLTTSATYEPSFNHVASTTDARNQTTNFTYTAQGLPLSVLSPADSGGVRPETTFTYTSFTPAGWPSFFLGTSSTVKTTATNSVVTTTSYNAANKYVPQTTVVDAGTGKLNLTTGYTYDGVGNLTQVNGPRTDVSDITTTTYDAERRPTLLTDALGKQTQLAYDADGRLLRSSAQIGAQWLTSCQTHTVSGKLLKAWGPALTATSTVCPAAAAPVAVSDYVYDDLDRVQRVTQNLTAAEGGSRVSETVYNLDNSVQSVKQAVGSAVAQTYAAYTYNLNNQVLTVKDARGNLTTYEYDGHGRRKTTFFPDKTAVGTSSSIDKEAAVYDNNGNVTQLTKRSGSVINFTYDNLNRLRTRVYPATTGENINYAYDLIGRRTAVAYANASSRVDYVWDNVGRLSSTTASGKTLSYQYDAASNRTRITWPDGAPTAPFYVSTTYDALNRPLALLENGSVSLASYAYDDLSRRSTVTLGNGTTTGYSYNTQGLPSGLAHNLAGTAQDINYAYSRNQAQEITTHSWNNDSYQWSSAVNGTKGYANNGLNQITNYAGQAYSHDTNGNLSQTGSWNYGYDADNRLRTASTKAGVSPAVTAVLVYDPEGRLRQTNINDTNRTRMLYDGVDLVAEYDESLNNQRRRYVHGPGIDEPLVWYEGAGTANKTWLYADHLGSIVGTANASGASTSIKTYSPFGETKDSVATNQRFGYTGQTQLKELGLYYYKARIYHPTLGRFLQTDPIGYGDGLNLYAYVGNGPVNFRDPSGLLAAEAQILAGKLGDSLGNWWDASVAGFRSESVGSAVERTLAGWPVGAAVVGAASRGGRVVNQVGQAGETAVRSAYDIGPATAFFVNGRNRVADGLNAVQGTITEVKNVAYQHLSTQIQDSIAHAQAAGLQFQLFVRESTALSAPLMDQVRAGFIRIGIIPPKGP